MGEVDIRKRAKMFVACKFTFATVVLPRMEAESLKEAVDSAFLKPMADPEHMLFTVVRSSDRIRFWYGARLQTIVGFKETKRNNSKMTEQA
jgi:hypothetical protein